MSSEKKFKNEDKDEMISLFQINNFKNQNLLTLIG
jgi:hypothetical protein